MINSYAIRKFYSGECYNIEMLYDELSYCQKEVKRYEDEDTYSGDQFFQDALQDLSAIEECIENYSLYYDEDGNYIYKEDK